MFKKAEFEVDEQSLVIRQELEDEDESTVKTIEEPKVTVLNSKTVSFENDSISGIEDTVSSSKTVTFKDTVKIVRPNLTVKTVPSKLIVNSSQTVTSKPTVSKTKKNRNGKLGINKKDNYSYIPNAPRKLCNNCGSSNHLTHVCTKVKSEVRNAMSVNGNLNCIPLNDWKVAHCGDFDCISCRMKLMSICFNMPFSSNQSCMHETVKTKRAKTPSPPKARMDKLPKNNLIKPIVKTKWVAPGVMLKPK